MAEYTESICRRCFHSYVCEQFNEHRDDNNKKCHFFNDHFVPAADVAPVRHGRWILEAHDERVNYRWNVTAECSECCNGQEKIWAGFFPNIPGCIARGAALVSAESVKLSNYCPNCGAKMDLEGGNT